MSGLGFIFKKAAGRVLKTSFRLKNYHNFRTTLRNAKSFLQVIKTLSAEDLYEFLWRSIRNEKVTGKNTLPKTGFDSKLMSLKNFCH